MHRDYLNAQRRSKFGKIVVVGVNGGLPLSLCNRDDLPIKFEFGASYIHARTQVASSDCIMRHSSQLHGSALVEWLDSKTACGTKNGQIFGTRFSSMYENLAKGRCRNDDRFTLSFDIPDEEIYACLYVGNGIARLRVERSFRIGLKEME